LQVLYGKLLLVASKFLKHSAGFSHTTLLHQKTVVMKPEFFLQSDLLDILFIGRNKAYGAYELRRNYDRRLKRSLLVMFSIVALLVSSKVLYAKYFSPKVSSVSGQPLVEIHLDPLENKKKPEKPAAAKPAAQKPIAQVANPTIVIVPDVDADKLVKPVADLDGKLIGIVDVTGDSATGVPIINTPVPGPGTGTAVEPIAVQEDSKPLNFAEVMPEFPGGQAAFLRFMLRNLRQPEDMEAGQKIVVRVKFVVQADGSINDVEILQSGGELDKEVLRVVNKMPVWKAGHQNGRPVAVYFQLPVTFVGGEVE
jgi:protein TonB